VTNVFPKILSQDNIKTLTSVENNNIYIQIKVSETKWNTLKRICFMKHIYVQQGFELAIFSFLDDKLNKINSKIENSDNKH